MVEWAGCDLSNFECFIPGVLIPTLTHSLWDVHSLQWLQFSHNGAQNKKKYEQTNKQRKLSVSVKFVDKKSLVAGRGHSRMTRFVQADRGPTKMQVRAQYHSDVQEGISNQKLVIS